MEDSYTSYEDEAPEGYSNGTDCSIRGDSQIHRQHRINSKETEKSGWSDKEIGENGLTRKESL